MKVDTPEEVYDSVTTVFQWLKTKCVRIWTFLSSMKFLISLNTIALLLTGLLLMTIGMLIITVSAKYKLFLGISYFVLPIFVVVIATVVLSTAALGWYSVKSERYDFFSVYLALLLAIWIFEIAIIVLGIQIDFDLYRDKVINHKMYDSKMAYLNGYNYGVDWDIMQNELQCCGYDSHKDYGLDIPLSCCRMPWRGQSPFQCTSSLVHYYGCRMEVNWMLAKYARALVIIAFTVTGVQGIVLAVAAFIAYKMKKQRENSYKNPLPKTDYSQYSTIPEKTAQ